MEKARDCFSVITLSVTGAVRRGQQVYALDLAEEIKRSASLELRKHPGGGSMGRQFGENNLYG